MASNKNPATTFFFNDWDNDPELKACSLAAQGLWMRCLCIAARSPEPGVVLVKGQPSGRQDLPSTLARLVGQPPETLAQLLDELIATETASVDRKGRVVCRRMLRAAGISLKMAINGARGAEVTNGKKRQKEGLPTETGGKSSSKDAGKPLSKSPASSNLQSSESSSNQQRSPEPRASTPPPDAVADAKARAMAIVEQHFPDIRKDIRAYPALTSTQGMISSWLAEGADIERDVLPAIDGECLKLVAKNRPPKGFGWFAEAVAANMARNTDRLPSPAPQPRGHNIERSGPAPADPWAIRVENHRDQLAAGRPIKDTTWHDFHLHWGPMPGESGCRAPAELIAKYGPWPKKEAA